MRVKQGRGYQLVSIRGIVVPAGWDETGTVTAVGLLDTDEQEYLIDNNKKQ